MDCKNCDNRPAAVPYLVDESLELVAYRIKASNAERVRRAMSETGKSGGAIIDELIEKLLK